MLTPPGYRKRLMADLERWAETGVISRAAADAIAVEYKTDPSHAILTVLAFVFAILAAGGLIALVAPAATTNARAAVVSTDGRPTASRPGSARRACPRRSTARGATR